MKNLLHYESMILFYPVKLLIIPYRAILAQLLLSLLESGVQPVTHIFHVCVEMLSRGSGFC
jgi:hypothetical protein